MSLATNATMIFSAYAVEDGGIRLRFVCSNPGGGEPSDYDCVLTDAEIAGVNTQAQLRTLVTTKLGRKLRATGFTAKLDPFIGQSVTI